MKKLLSILIFLLFIVACRDQDIQSSWTNEKISIDGRLQDWKDIPRLYEKDIKIMLGVANDSLNIYLMYCFNNPELARTIAMHGFNLWISEAGQKNKNFGLLFKGQLPETGYSSEPTIRTDRMRERPPYGENVKTILDKCQFILHRGDSIPDMPLMNGSNLKAAFNMVEGLYGFEFSLPISEFNQIVMTLNQAQVRLFSIGLEIPDMETQMRSGQKDGTGMSGNRGIRGGAMGGRGQRMPDPGDRIKPKLNMKEIWANVSLAGRNI